MGLVSQPWWPEHMEASVELCWEWGWSVRHGAAWHGAHPGETPACEMQVKPHGDLGGGEGNLPVTVTGPPGAMELENPEPHRRPERLAGQRELTGTWHSPKRQALVVESPRMSHVPLQAQGPCRRGNSGGSIFMACGVTPLH